VACGGSPLRAGSEDSAPEASAAPPRPVVVVLVDTLRADHLGLYGYERDTSPHLDRWAEEAVVFERCVAQSSWTKPATASILTGLNPSEHGVQREASRLDAELETLAEPFQAAGWRTGAFVTNGFIGRADAGFEQGFDEFVAYDAPEPRLYVRAEHVLADALAWVEGVADAPFFLFVHLLDPHEPYDPPAPFDERFAAAPEGAANEHARSIDRYDGEIAYVDRELGRFFDGLRALGRYEETLIAFLSDHGEEFGEHGRRGHSAHLHDEVLAVPLVIRFPAGRADLPRGTRHAGLVRQIDLFPTLLAAAGLTPPEVAGVNLLERLAVEPREGLLALSEVDLAGAYQKAVVARDAKYIREFVPRSRELFFDLGSDPAERVNAIAASPARAEALRSALDSYLGSTQTGFDLVFHNDREAERELTILLVSRSAALEGVELLFGEDGDGPASTEAITHAGAPAFLTRLVLRCRPGDRDGLHFEPARDESELWLSVRVDGAELDPAAARLGASDASPTGWPLELLAADLLDPAGLSALPDAAAPGGVLHVWRNAGATAEEVTFTDEERENLRRLGYTGE